MKLPPFLLNEWKSVLLCDISPPFIHLYLTWITEFRSPNSKESDKCMPLKCMKAGSFNRKFGETYRWVVITVHTEQTVNIYQYRSLLRIFMFNHKLCQLVVSPHSHTLDFYGQNVQREKIFVLNILTFFLCVCNAYEDSPFIPNVEEKI